MKPNQRWYIINTNTKDSTLHKPWTRRSWKLDHYTLVPTKCGTQGLLAYTANPTNICPNC